MKCQLVHAIGYPIKSKNKKERNLGVFYSMGKDGRTVIVSDFEEHNNVKVTSLVECDGKVVVNVRTSGDCRYTELEVEYKCDKCKHFNFPDHLPEDEEGVRELIQDKLDSMK